MRMAIAIGLFLSLTEACSSATVSSVAPNSGPTAGGTSVTITGTGFVNVEQVTFGGVPAQSFTVNSSTSITAVAPPDSSAVAVNVRVTVRTTSPVSAGDKFTYTATSPPPPPPPGSPQYPNLLSSYIARPSWQVAGVDYPVGIPAGTVLKDPLTINIPGVSLDGNAKNVFINGDNITLDGYDFSLEGGWSVNIEGANAVVQNSNFADGPSGNIAIYVDSPAANATIQYNNMDGKGLPGQPGFTVTATAGYSNVVGINGVGTTTFQYNYVHDAYGQLVVDGSLVGGENYLIRYNLFANAGEGTSSGAHGDWIQTFNQSSSDNLNNYTISYNTFIQNIPVSNAGTASQSITSNGLMGGVGIWSITNNTFVVPANANVNYGVCFIDPSYVISSLTITDNYMDPSGVQFGWYFVGATGAPPGPYTPQVTVTGNINMTNGSTFAP